MNKKWIVIPSVLVLFVTGAIAAIRLGEHHGTTPKVVLDGPLRQQTLDALVAKLNAHYVFPDKARQMEALLRQRQHERSYDGITDGDELAKQLSADLDSVAHDQHMDVEFSPEVVPPDDAFGPPPVTLAEWEAHSSLALRLFRHVSSLGVAKVDHLSPAIGYLQVTEFPPHFFVREKYAAAMDKLADTDGLIVDVRDNHGGDPQAVALLVSYFVDRRTRLNDIWERDTGLTTQQWTQDRLDGKRYGGKKPVMILAGPGTMSAGEDFAYTMQALQRATVIGAPTWGGANPSRPYRLGDHFLVFIPARRTISPVTHTNWEQVGVAPDIPATDNALTVAQDLLLRRLHGTPSAVVARR